MLDFAIRGTKRAGSDLVSGPASKKYHVTPVAPPKPARIRRAPQTVESSPVKSPPRSVSPVKAKSSKPSWYTKTAAMKEADSKNDLQIQVNGQDGELGKPTRFFRKNYVILSHPENLIQGKFQKKNAFFNYYYFQLLLPQTVTNELVSTLKTTLVFTSTTGTSSFPKSKKGTLER